MDYRRFVSGRFRGGAGIGYICHTRLAFPAMEFSDRGSLVYPAMREIDHQFQLNLTWANPNDPTDMATKLKQMETDMEAARGRLPSEEVFSRQSVDRLAGEYWKVIREYL